jgi:CRISPR-associated protein Csm1
MEKIELARAAWAGEPVAGHEQIPAWPVNGIAIEGDFSGIQRFVLRPVPGASGAARRLRARSFRVLALTRLVAAIVEERFRDAGARLFYSAGGRFLVATNPCTEWRDRIASLQRDLDEDLLKTYRGELVFHLAGAEFADGNIPVVGLREAMADRKQMPLGSVLRTGDGWATDRFIFAATQHGKCEGCGSTAMLSDDSEALCQTCVDDRELGKALLRGGRASLSNSLHGSIRLLGAGWAISPDGQITIPLVSHVPVERGQLATFEDLSARAAGRRYLAYLRIDADRIGLEFRNLAGNPRRTWGLSTLLDSAFSSAVPNLIGSKFPNLYPVYGGGDDLFVIGPWNDILDFAAAWRSEFRAISDNKLTFSAGVALAKPRQHILTKSDDAEHALSEHAKGPRDSIRVLGCTMPWPEFDEALAGARRLAAMHAERQIKSALLNNIVELHDRARNGDARWHSLLFYQIERNLTGEAKSFVRSAFLAPGNLWKHANFIARYAMLHLSGEERN